MVSDARYLKKEALKPTDRNERNINVRVEIE